MNLKAFSRLMAVSLIGIAVANSFADTTQPSEPEALPRHRSINLLFHDAAIMRISMNNLKISMETDSMLFCSPEGKMKVGLSEIKGWTHSPEPGQSLPDESPGIPNSIETPVSDNDIRITLADGYLTVGNIVENDKIALITLDGKNIRMIKGTDENEVIFPLERASGVAILQINRKSIKLILPQQ